MEKKKKCRITLLTVLHCCADAGIARMAVVQEPSGRGEEIVGLPEGLRDHGRGGRRVLRAVDLRGVRQVRRSGPVRRLRHRQPAPVVRQVLADQHPRHCQR